jgi:hypothetical protein
MKDARAGVNFRRRSCFPRFQFKNEVFGDFTLLVLPPFSPPCTPCAPPCAPLVLPPLLGEVEEKRH